MKKLIIFLFMAVYVTCLTSQNVKAVSFYGAEKLETYYNKEKGDIFMSRKSQVIRQKQTKELAYCIEPFTLLLDGEEYDKVYKSYHVKLNISSKQYERIKQIAYYGFGYKGHTADKWHSITQILIWRTVDPDGKYYWVDGLNGNKIEGYKKEIAELEKLIEKHNKLPSFSNTLLEISTGKEYVFEDKNDVLSDFEIVSGDIETQINGNMLSVKASTSGDYEIILKKSGERFNKETAIYQDSKSQAVMLVGNYSEILVKVKVKVTTGKITIVKKDKDTDSKNPMGEAQLDGAVYGIYNQENELIEELTIINNEASLNNLSHGNYYIKEIKSGKGYYLDKEIYDFTINQDTLQVQLEVGNEVIKNRLVIRKYYGTSKKVKPEANIIFNIYNNKKEKVANITTDEDGFASIELPYGKYLISQENTTDNYEKVEDFYITIDENSDTILEYELEDFRIEVPNAGIENSNVKTLYLNFLLINTFVIMLRKKHA